MRFWKTKFRKLGIFRFFPLLVQRVRGGRRVQTFLTSVSVSSMNFVVKSDVFKTSFSKSIWIPHGELNLRCINKSWKKNFNRLFFLSYAREVVCKSILTPESKFSMILTFESDIFKSSSPESSPHPELNMTCWKKKFENKKTWIFFGVWSGRDIEAILTAKSKCSMIFTVESDIFRSSRSESIPQSELNLKCWNNKLLKNNDVAAVFSFCLLWKGFSGYSGPGIEILD